MNSSQIVRPTRWGERLAPYHLAHRWRALPRPLRRATAAAVGSVLLAAGLIMLVVPGPGLLTLALGMVVLATEFAWPRRLLRRLAARLPLGRLHAGWLGPDRPGRAEGDHRR